MLLSLELSVLSAKRAECVVRDFPVVVSIPLERPSKARKPPLSRSLLLLLRMRATTIHTGRQDV